MWLNPSKDPSMMDVDLGDAHMHVASSSTQTEDPLSLSSRRTVEQLSTGLPSHSSLSLPVPHL